MRFGWILAAALLAAAGCSSSEPGDQGSGGTGGRSDGGSGGSAGSGGRGGTGGDGGTGGEIVIPTDEFDLGWEPETPAALEAPIDGDDRPASCGSQFGYFSVVRGWAAAPGGKTLDGANAFLCLTSSTGQGTCLNPVRADVDGVYTVSVPENYRCFREAAMRVLQYDSHRSTQYCPIGLDGEPVLRLREPAVLPFANPAIDLPPVGDPDAPRDVVFDDGLVVVATPSKFFEEERGDTYRDFSGRRVPVDAVGLCGDAPTFDGLYALYPEGAVDAPGYPVRIPNTNGYQPGTRVELFVLGGLNCRLHADGDPKVPEGTWAKFGEAIVSDRGDFIVSGDNSGLPCFTWLAYRAKE